MHLSNGLVSFDHNPQDAELVTDYTGCGNQTERVETDGAAHVTDEVIGSVPEEDTPEPGRNSTCRHVVVTSDCFRKFVVSFRLEQVRHTTNLLLSSSGTLSERHLSGHRSRSIDDSIEEVINVLCSIDLLRARTGWLMHFSELLGEGDEHKLADDLFHTFSALQKDFVNLGFFHFFPVPRDTFFIFLELVIKLSNQSLVNVSQRIAELLSSISVQADLIIREKVKLLNRFHQEAISQNRSKILVKAHETMFVLVV